jgi:hypothetical protein
MLWLMRIVAGFPSQQPEYEPRSAYAVFVMDKMVFRQDFSENVSFSCQFSFH